MSCRLTFKTDQKKGLTCSGLISTPRGRMYSPSSPVLSSLDPPTTVTSQQDGQCLRFKYFTTFIICTTCLALLSASLATHKWIVAKPIRTLRLNGGQTNLTSLMLTAQSDSNDRHQSSPISSAFANGATSQIEPTSPAQSSHNSKFQGEIYFGLFKGVKVLNYGFGDRISPISGELIFQYLH